MVQSDHRHLGGILLWVSIFVVDYQLPLQGIAYGLWFVSAVPILIELWRITRTGLSNLENERLSQGVYRGNTLSMTSNERQLAPIDK